MDKPILYMTIGLPASGKSTYFSKLNDLETVCGDTIRREFFGDEGIQLSEGFLTARGYDLSSLTRQQKEKLCNKLVWDEAKERALRFLKEGRNVAYDGIHLRREIRKNVIASFSPYALIHGLYFVTPLELCIARDRKRKRTIGEARICELSRFMETPSLEEGFDRLETIDQNGQRVSLKTR